MEHGGQYQRHPSGPAARLESRIKTQTLTDELLKVSGTLLSGTASASIMEHVVGVPRLVPSLIDLSGCGAAAPSRVC